MLKYQLPDLYQKLFPPKLLNFKINETLATCDDCAMTADKNKKSEVTYLANLKCCTFHPFQPNFLIGGLLETGRLEQRALKNIQMKIKKNEYVLPMGIVAPVSHQVEFNQRKQGEFGNRQDWLCPYYNTQSNNCGIWKFRSAVCTTFFCQSSYKKKGLKFWDLMSDYLTYVEAALMEEALVMLDFSPRQVSDNLSYLNRFSATEEELKASQMDLKLSRDIWNGYFDDQEGFFKKCYQIILKIDKTQFKEIMGDQGHVIEKNLFLALAQL